MIEAQAVAGGEPDARLSRLCGITAKVEKRSCGAKFSAAGSAAVAKNGHVTAIDALLAAGWLHPRRLKIGGVAECRAWSG
jgi:hypothetical protein